MDCVALADLVSVRDNGESHGSLWAVISGLSLPEASDLCILYKILYKKETPTWLHSSFACDFQLMGNLTHEETLSPRH